ncbi:hypothetical protein [Sphingobacterium paucimobilis]|nr:hypothetical protein [Sphingobacterium paucimobilis]
MSNIYQIVFILFFIGTSNCTHGQSKQECLDMLHDNLILLESFLHADQYDGGAAEFHERCSCAVAQDRKTELFGIIDLDGNWCIAPSFIFLREKWGDKGLFLGQLPGEDKSFEYTYDREKRTLTKM